MKNAGRKIMKGMCVCEWEREREREREVECEMNFYREGEREKERPTQIEERQKLCLRWTTIWERERDSVRKWDSFTHVSLGERLCFKGADRKKSEKAFLKKRANSTL